MSNTPKTNQAVQVAIKIFLKPNCACAYEDKGLTRIINNAHLVIPAVRIAVLGADVRGDGTRLSNSPGLEQVVKAFNYRRVRNFGGPADHRAYAILT